MQVNTERCLAHARAVLGGPRLSFGAACSPA